MTVTPLKKNFSNALALIVEDHPESAIKAKNLLQLAFPDLQSISFENAEDTTQWLESKPKKDNDKKLAISLVDLGLPDKSGINVIQKIKSLEPEAIIVVMTIFKDDSHVFDALKAGACGYLLKDDPENLTLEIIKRLYEGEPPLSPSVAYKILTHFQNKKIDQEAEVKLSPRETETLTLIAKGLSVPEIATKLSLSPQTIAGYVKTVYQKLHISNRVEATHKAIERGLV
jgi:DNA-binding NarL/FixJ family response regulator